MACGSMFIPEKGIAILTHHRGKNVIMQQISEILVPITCTEAVCDPRQLSLSLQLAGACNAHLRFMVFEENIPQLVGPIPLDAGLLKKNRAQECQIVLDACLAQAREAGLHATADLVWGNPINRLIQEIQHHRVDLVVKSAEYHRFLGCRRLSGNDISVLRLSVAPVLLLAEEPPDHPVTLKTLLVAVDISPDNEALNIRLLEWGRQLAELQQTRLHAVHTWRLIGEDYMTRARYHAPLKLHARLENILKTDHMKRFQHLLASAGLTHGENVTAHLVRGRASEEICRLNEELDVDLMIMGTHARRGLEKFMIGNTAENVAANVKSSLLIVRPDH